MLPDIPVPVYHATTVLSTTSSGAQAAQGFPAPYPKSEVAHYRSQAGPYHFGVESPDGRAGCQQLRDLPFLLL